MPLGRSIHPFVGRKLLDLGACSTLTTMNLIIEKPTQTSNSTNSHMEAWFPWAAFASDAQLLIDLMAGTILRFPLSDKQIEIAVSAVSDFKSPNLSEQNRTRAKIAYFLLTSFGDTRATANSSD